MKSLKTFWEKIINIGITPELHEKDAKYIRLTNALVVIVAAWLFSTIPSLMPLYPSSRFLILNSILFPILWPFSLYLNYKHYYIAAKLYFSYASLICISLNALQVGREADNHLFLLLLSIFAFYSYPPKQMKYITLVSLSSLFCFIGIDSRFHENDNKLITYANSR